MHWTRLFIVRVGVAGAAVLGAGAWGERGTPPAAAVGMARTIPSLVRVVNIGSGQAIELGEAGVALPAPHPVRGTGTVAFDTMTSPESTAGLNVAYLDPDSYTGRSTSTHAFAISLAERLVYRAPMDPENGFPLPTDILWNDYACEAAHWPGGDGGPAQPVASFEFIPYFQNSEPPLRARDHTLRVQFFSADGLTDHGGFEAVYRVSPGQTGYFGASIDLAAMDPPISVPRTGWVMVDWVEPGNSGVGCMFTGGDLENDAYPRPETLWTRGSCDVDAWRFCDGVTGTGGPPALVNPGFDGDPSSTSYLDIFNTGAAANWQFTGGNPASMYMAHGFAWRLSIGGPAPACPCDVDGSGSVNSQDFFDFVVGFFSGDADFDGSGETTSQDFFDFLICFFGPC